MDLGYYGHYLSEKSSLNQVMDSGMNKIFLLEYPPNGLPIKTYGISNNVVVHL